MASTTPNIGLTLPTGAEKVSRQIINDNNTKIDTAIGGTAGRELLGYKENGDTASQAISNGSFVVWKGSLCKANGNISQGATLSALNLTAVPSGGFNDLQGQVDSLSDSLATSGVLVTLAYGDITTTSQTLNLLSGEKLSDYKRLVLCSIDAQIILCSTTINRDTFVDGYKLGSNAYALNNYRATVVCNYVSDTSVSMYAREMVGWTQVRCILYGIK